MISENTTSPVLTDLDSNVTNYDSTERVLALADAFLKEFEPEEINTKKNGKYDIVFFFLLFKYNNNNQYLFR